LDDLKELIFFSEGYKKSTYMYTHKYIHVPVCIL